MRSSTNRVRRLRERRRHGKIQATIECDEVGLVECLIDATTLTPDKRDDVEAIRRALQLMVDMIIVEHRSKCGR